MALAALKKPRVSVASSWIRANAGSGKTTALVERVLALLIRGVLPERICCITYTKAAAAEMQTRILRELRELLLVDDIACHSKLTELLGAPPTQSQMELARSLFARVLDSPFGGLQLTTIHGFCQQLLRRFPMEAGLSPQFTVMEDGEGEVLERLARQRLIKEAHGEVADALALLAERAGEHGFRDLLKSAISDSGYWWQLHEAYPLPEQLKEALFDEYELEDGVTDEQLCAATVAILIPQTLEAPLRSVLGQFTAKTDAPFAAIFTRWMDGTGDRLQLLDELCGLMFTQKGEPRKNPYTKKAPLQDSMAIMVELCVSLQLRRNALAMAEESYAAALVAIHYLRYYDQLKNEYQSLDYNDLITAAATLLETNSGWVMSKLDHRIDHLMIDEAQDTSAGQWRIVRTLFDELLSEGGIGSGNVLRSLLVVGDEKQSIFSFQGADPEQFMAEENHFSTRLHAVGQPLEQRQLEASYRSAKAILDVVDAVGNLPEVAQGLSASGHPSHHIFRREDRIGRVVLHPPGEKIGKEKPAPFTLPTEYIVRETAPQKLAQRMARTIRGWLDAGTWEAGDILILLWRRQPFADALIRALEAEKIPVAGLDRLQLSEHLAVRDCLAAIQWCGYTGDDLSLAHLLRSPIIGMDEATLESLAFARPGTLWAQVQMHQPGIATQLQALLDVRHASPYAFLTQLLEVQGARTRFSQRFGAEVQEVLDELKAQSLAIPTRLAPSIAAFADWLIRSGREVKRQQEGKGQSVRIMTVHGAKGLEAPVVLVVNPTQLPSTAKERVLHSEQGLPSIGFSDEAKQAANLIKEKRRRSLFDEYYRLLYVALTRAEEELHLFAAEPPDDESWYGMVRRAMQDMSDISEEEGALVLQDSGYRTPKAALSPSVRAALPNWLHAIPSTAASSQRVLSPSRLVETTEVEGDAIRSAVGANIRGVRIHRVLQFLHADSDMAHITQLLRLAAPDWDEAKIVSTAVEISKLHVQENWLWQLPGHPEVSLAGEVAGQRYSGQVDRLIITPEAVVIVDYKTGAHIPKAAAAVPDAYRQQLTIYRALLAQIYPDKPIRSALLYSAGPQLLWLD